MKIAKHLLYLSLIYLIISVGIIAKPVQATTLVVASDEWCPYVCNNDTLPGFLLEVVTEIAANNGIKVRFHLSPLARALDLAEKGQVDILLALTAQHITDFNLQQSDMTFGGFYNDFYVRSSEAWRFTTLDDLDAKLKSNAILGTINGYQYGSKISKLLAENVNHVFPASGSSPLQKQLKMLKMGRLDILLDSRFTVQYQLSRLLNASAQVKSPSRSTIVYAGTEGGFAPLFLGFSPLLSKAQMQVFDNGLIALRKSGRLKKILLKYGVTDWQP